MIRSLLSRLWRARHFVPLTPLGALLLVAAVGVHYWLAVSEVDFVLHAASLVALGLVAFSVFAVIVVTVLLWLRLRGVRDGAGPLALESGRRAGTGFSSPRFRFWPLVQITLAWDQPSDADVSMERTRGAVASGLESRWQEVVACATRGRYSCLRRRFFVGDIFGLARIGLPRRSSRPLRIAPSKAPITGHVVSHFVGGEAISHPSGPTGGDRLDMRRYAYGDPLRHVLWKAFARTRQLLVRTPERAIAPSPSGVAYFIAGRGDEPTASLARSFVEEGLLGDDFLFCADGSSQPTADADQALEQIIDSAAFRQHGARGLSRFLDQVGEKRRKACVLFVPPSGGAWEARVERVARQIPGATAVLALDQDVRPRRRSLLSRLLLVDDGASPRRLRQLPRLVARLSKSGIKVKVVHRPTGQLVAGPQLEALSG